MIPMLCKSCGKKLAEVIIKEGVVSIKCGKCGTLNQLETTKKEINTSSTKSTNSN